MSNRTAVYNAYGKQIEHIRVAWTIFSVPKLMPALDGRYCIREHLSKSKVMVSQCRIASMAFDARDGNENAESECQNACKSMTGDGLTMVILNLDLQCMYQGLRRFLRCLRRSQICQRDHGYVVVNQQRVPNIKIHRSPIMPMN